MRARTLVLVVPALAAALLGAYLLGRRSARLEPAATTAAEAAVEYVCPMHPQVVRDHPGQCPICQMTLVRREKRPPGSPELVGRVQPVPGRAEVILSPDRERALALRSEAVAEADLAREVRTVGRIAVDERRVQQVYTKYDGYVERLLVDFTGQPVKRGQPLLELYSPELLAALEEYVLAVKARQQMAQSGTPGLEAQGAALLSAARRRLELLDVPKAELERLEAGEDPRRTATLYAQVEGVVTQKRVAPGTRVTPADPLFEVADLSRVWVLADVYEQDMAVAAAGTRGEVRAVALPGRAWRGVVSFVSPAVDAATRTVKVRLEVENPDRALRPEMFVEVALQGARGRGLVVPEGAVIDSGPRQIVFVDKGEGRYEPREVTVGAKVGRAFVVLSGLAKGERVVLSGNFLLDSESSLQAARP